jgi:regulator of RNase E activity RraB
MEEHWVGHMLEGEEGTASCLINIALAESCPDSGRPLFTMVRIPFKRPGDDGLGADTERDKLGDFEDAMESATKRHGALHVATVRGFGNLDVLFYSPAVAEAALKAVAQDVCKGYKVEVGSEADPAWEQYQNLFPPREAIDSFDDMQLLQVLQEQGDRASRPRPVDHALMLPSADAADQAAKTAARLGYAETDRHTREGEPLAVCLQLTKQHNVEPETVGAARGELTKVAEDLGGEYDGWQTPLAT